MRVLLPVLVATVCAACCPKQMPPPTLPQVVIPAACELAGPPPSPPGVEPAEDCPLIYEVCLGWDEAGKLNQYLAELQRWARDAWTTCGGPQ